MFVFCSTRYTGHTLAKFIVTCATGVICGCVLVALNTFVKLLSEWKLEFIQNTLLKEEGNIGEQFEGNTFGRVAVAFLKFTLFGTVLVTIGTAMVGSMHAQSHMYHVTQHAALCQTMEGMLELFHLTIQRRSSIGLHLPLVLV